MLSRFFIDRPIFAWVVALIIMLIGGISITRLPIARYPVIAPPSVNISASYPGASAQTVEDSVTQIIEQNMTALDGLLYMDSTSDSAGNVSITLTFASGTNPDIAQVQVQNRLQQAVPLLPQIVQLQGISVSKSTGSQLMAVGFVSEDGSMSVGDIADWLATNVVDPVSRVEGVGGVQLFGAKYAMRIWLDADKLNGYGLTPADITSAIQAQNAQISIGQLGDSPAVPGTHGTRPPAHARAVRQHHPAQQQRWLEPAPARCGAHRIGTRQLRLQRQVQRQIGLGLRRQSCHGRQRPAHCNGCQ